MLRPFLAPLWAVLSSETTDEGASDTSLRRRSRTAGKLVHTKRIAEWRRELLPQKDIRGLSTPPRFTSWLQTPVHGAWEVLLVRV